MHSERLQLLQRMPLLAGLPHGELERLAEHVQEKRFDTGAELIKEGTSGFSAFFIVSGRCEVRRRSGTEAVRLAYLEPGDFFGELAILDPAPRSATVSALEPTATLVLDEYQFKAALQTNLSMALHLVKVLAARLRAFEDEFARYFRKG